MIHRGALAATHALMAAAHVHAAVHLLHRHPRAAGRVGVAVGLVAVPATCIALARARIAARSVDARRAHAARCRVATVLAVALAIAWRARLSVGAVLARARAGGIADAAAGTGRRRAGALAIARCTAFARPARLARARARATGPRVPAARHRTVALASRAVTARAVHRAQACAVAITERSLVAVATRVLAVMVPQAHVIAMRPRATVGSVAGARGGIGVIAARIGAGAEPHGAARRCRTLDLEGVPSATIDGAARRRIAGSRARIRCEVAGEERGGAVVVVLRAAGQPRRDSGEQEQRRARESWKSCGHRREAWRGDGGTANEGIARSHHTFANVEQSAQDIRTRPQASACGRRACAGQSSAAAVSARAGTQALVTPGCERSQ